PGEALDKPTEHTDAAAVDADADRGGAAVKLVHLAVDRLQLRERGSSVGPDRDVGLRRGEPAQPGLEGGDLAARFLSADVDADPLAVQRGQFAADLGELAVGVRGVGVELDVRQRLDGAADPPLHVVGELADLPLGLLRVDVDLRVGTLPIELLQLVGDPVNRVREALKVGRVAAPEDVEPKGLGDESPPLVVELCVYGVVAVAGRIRTRGPPAPRPAAGWPSSSPLSWSGLAALRGSPAPRPAWTSTGRWSSRTRRRGGVP